MPRKRPPIAIIDETLKTPAAQLIPEGYINETPEQKRVPENIISPSNEDPFVSKSPECTSQSCGWGRATRARSREALKAASQNPAAGAAKTYKSRIPVRLPMTPPVHLNTVQAVKRVFKDDRDRFAAAGVVENPDPREIDMLRKDHGKVKLPRAHWTAEGYKADPDLFEDETEDTFILKKDSLQITSKQRVEGK